MSGPGLVGSWLGRSGPKDPELGPGWV
eukprot:gene26611-biopygen16995